jgi:phospholipid/cholesterol/gamma-HCH transport system substrate-binding protein
METRAHYVAVGSFVLVMIALAFLAVLWLGRIEFSRQFAYYDIYFTGSVTGLSEGAVVLYNGVRIGRVAEIRLDPLNVEQIRVTVELDPNAVIKSDAQAVLDTNLLSGVSFIQIRGGTKDAPELKRKEGQRYPVIASERSAMERVYSRAPKLLEKLIDVADNINQLLDEKNRAAVSDSLQNVRTLTGHLDDRSKELRPVLADADTAVNQLKSLLHDVDDSYVKEDGLRDRAAQLLGDYDKLARNLSDTNRQLQQILAENRPGIHEFTQRTVNQLNDLLAETRQLVAGASRVVDDLQRDPARFLLGDRREGYRPR